MSYTYLLKHKPTNTFYYGVRWAKNCKPDEFWVTYFTSSEKLIPLLRTLFGDDSFEFEIRKTFESAQKAREWEHKVLRRMKVLKKSDIWLNRTDNRAIVYDVHPNLGKPSWHKGIPKSKEQRMKMSLAQKGIPKSENHKKIMSLRHADVNGSKNPNYGKRHYFINNGKILKKISIDQPIPYGWTKGFGGLK